jgi:thiamine pyrophosphate-dependent acetolactate synthase large subunit-like protein
MSGARAETYPLRRREVVAALLAERGDLLVIAGLGAPAWDTAAAGDHPLTFPLWGAMGGALAMGLGLALAQPSRRVLVITGDGEMLMGLGMLATTAVQAPGNLAAVVLDNERYGETGMQATHTAPDAANRSAGNQGVDLAAMAASAGWKMTGTVRDEPALAKALPAIRAAQGPVFYDVKVRAEDLPLVLPPRDGVELKDRFRTALLGADG